jgi:hypothetical protein
LASRLLALAFRAQRMLGCRAGGFFLCLQIFFLRMAKSPGGNFQEVLGRDAMMDRPRRGHSGPGIPCNLPLVWLSAASFSQGAATSGGWLFSLPPELFSCYSFGNNSGMLLPSALGT